jgi:hypothetical protein
MTAVGAIGPGPKSVTMIVAPGVVGDLLLRKWRIDEAFGAVDVVVAKVHPMMHSKTMIVGFLSTIVEEDTTLKSTRIIIGEVVVHIAHDRLLTENDDDKNVDHGQSSVGIIMQVHPLQQGDGGGGDVVAAVVQGHRQYMVLLIQDGLAL